MARKITTRAEFITYCKRQLGYPVVQINVTDEQISDRIDDALNFMQEYHPDATQKTFVKYRLTQEDIDNRYIDMNRASGLVSVEANTNIVHGAGTSFQEDMQAAGAQIRINGETKTITAIANTTYLTVDSNFAASANNQPVYFPNTADFFNVVKIFSIGGSSSSASYMWDLQYQIRLNELYDFTSSSYVPYEITMQHLRTIQMLFVGDLEVRFNRRNNRLYIDGTWGGQKLIVNTWVIVEAYRILQPELFPQIWDDRWLKSYAVALIKKQWGSNMKKYKNIALIGGVTMSGQEFYDEACKEAEDLEDTLRDDIQAPPMFFIG